MPCTCAILPSVACTALPCCSTIFHKWHDYRIKFTENKMLFWIMKQILSETFLILGRAEWDIIINVVKHIQYIKCSVEFAHILSFCNVSCGSAENMVMVMMMMMMTVMTSRGRRGYLKKLLLAQFPNPPMLLYSSISVHCQSINSLFRLPHSMLTVLYRNQSAWHFIGQEEQ